jgi:two-component sensor histidine kinase
MLNQPFPSNQYRLSRQLLTRVGVTLVIIGCLILNLNYFWQITNLKQQIRNQAQSMTDSLGLIMTEQIEAKNINRLTSILQKISLMPMVIQVIIVNPEGQTLASSVSTQTLQESDFWLTQIVPQIEKANQTQAAVHFSSHIQNQPVFVYISPIDFLSSPLKIPPPIAITILDLQPVVRTAWQTFLNSILLLIGECLIVLILIGLLLRQAVLTPLNQLYQSLLQYQQGTTLEIPEQLPVNEIGVLAKAIYQQFIDLKQINAQLKIEVVERKKAEKKIQASLQEKELLLREIHHRVKNNLFIVSQIFEFQIDYLDNNQLIQILKECQNRIYSMGIIHDILYQNTNLKKINFAEYLTALIRYLNQSYNPHLNSSIQIQLELQPVILNIETANPCGLIVNELISNAFKHAFNEQKNGMIKVILTEDEVNQITIQVQDNGIGFPKDLDFQQVDSLGLELVRTLTQQLQGSLELDRSQGTLFQLTFTELSYNKSWSVETLK